MDLFPDWAEIGLNVKMWMIVFHAICIATAYFLFIRTAKGLQPRSRKALFLLTAIVTGLLLYGSMYLFDWEVVLP